MVFQLTDKLAFPDPHYGDPDGLLAVGGDLSIDRLILAYSNGIFPWYAFREELIQWWCPMDRFVIFPDEIHISHSMRTLINKGKYEITFNEAFQDVIQTCGELRMEQEGAWLGTKMMEAYTAPARTRIRRQRGSMGRRAIGRWAVRSDPGTLFLWREHVLTRSQRLEAGPHPSGPILQGTWRRHNRLPVRNPSPQNNGRQAHQLRRIYDIHRTRLPLLKVKRNNEGLRTIRA